MNTPEEKHLFDFSNTTSEHELLLKTNVNLSIPKQQKLKQLYAHEIGHLVGLLLNDKQCAPFGIPTRISFKNHDAKVEYDWTDEVFKVLRTEIEKDLYGFKGYKIAEYRKDCQTTKNYINKSYDLNRFSPFMSFSIIGGLFHLYWDSIINNYSIELKHFNEIFSDDKEDDPTTINGAAGNDWTKVRMYCGEYKIPYNVILQFREDLYKLCLESGLFKHFEAKIEELYNADKTEYVTDELSHLKNEMNSLLTCFLSMNTFLKALEDLQNQLKSSIN